MYLALKITVQIYSIRKGNEGVSSPVSDLVATSSIKRYEVLFWTYSGHILCEFEILRDKNINEVSFYAQSLK
jgi:hypothetical protein